MAKKKAYPATGLTECETEIMLTIWKYGKDISTLNLIKNYNEEYGKGYARSTVVTLLNRMMDKGFISTYKVGRESFIHPEKTRESYADYLLQKYIKTWYDGDASKLAEALKASGVLA